MSKRASILSYFDWLHSDPVRLGEDGKLSWLHYREYVNKCMVQTELEDFICERLKK